MKFFGKPLKQRSLFPVLFLKPACYVRKLISYIQLELFPRLRRKKKGTGGYVQLELFDMFDECLFG